MSPLKDQKSDCSREAARKPLTGRTILIARPRAQQDETATLFEAAGAKVVRFAAIRIGPPDDWRTVDDAIDRLDGFSWVVFSSSNGVRFFLERLKGRGWTPEAAFREARIAVVGPGTAHSLTPFGLRADLIPPIYRAESLAEEFEKQLSKRDRVLLVRAGRGREILAQRLRGLDVAVEEVVAYSSTDVTRETAPEAADIEEMIKSGEIDWIAVTSSAIGQSLVRIFGEAMAKARVAAISPITAEGLRSKEIRVDAVAEKHTIPGMIEAIAAHGIETT